MQEMLRLKQRIKKLKNVKKTRRNKKVRRGIFNSVMSADHDHDEFGHGVTSIGEMGDDFALVSKKANNVTNEDRISFLRKKWKTQLAPPSRPLRESVEFRMDGLGERVRTQTMVVHPLYPLGITWEATVGVHLVTTGHFASAGGGQHEGANHRKNTSDDHVHNI